MKWKWTCVLVRAVSGPHWTILNAFEITELWGESHIAKTKNKKSQSKTMGSVQLCWRQGACASCRGCVGRRAGWEEGQLPGRAHRGEQVPAQQGTQSRSSAMLSPQSLSSGPRPEVGAQPCGTSSALAQDRQAGVVTEPQSHGPTEPQESPAALPVQVRLHRPAQSKHASFLSLQPPGVPWRRNAAPLVGRVL